MTARVALSVAIVNAYISQGQIVGPTQVVSNGTDVATSVTTAIADMATLSTDIAAALAIATTVKTEAISLATYGTTAYNDAAASVLQCGTVQSTATALQSNVNNCATVATYGLTTLLNNQTYTAATGLLSGTPGSSVTLTVAQQQSFIANFNSISSVAGANVGLISQATTAVLDASTLSNFISGTIQPAANTLSANGTINLTDVTACSTQGTVVTNDLMAIGSTGINGQMYLVYDPTYVSDVAILTQELTAILNYLQTNGSIA